MVEPGRVRIMIFGGNMLSPEVQDREVVLGGGEMLAQERLDEPTIIFISLIILFGIGYFR